MGGEPWNIQTPEHLFCEGGFIKFTVHAKRHLLHHPSLITALSQPGITPDNYVNSHEDYLISRVNKGSTLGSVSHEMNHKQSLLRWVAPLNGKNSDAAISSGKKCIRQRMTDDGIRLGSEEDEKCVTGKMIQSEMAHRAW